MVTPREYAVFLRLRVAEDAREGLPWGALGGLFTAVVSLYWKGAKSFWGAALLWAGLAVGIVCALGAPLEEGGGGGPDRPWFGPVGRLLLTAGFGAYYGGVLALLVQSVYRPWRRARRMEQSTGVA